MSFTPQPLYPRGKGGSVGPRTGLDDVKERKFLTLPGHELRRKNVLFTNQQNKYLTVSKYPQ
jgi:hypothetical protein